MAPVEATSCSAGEWQPVWVHKRMHADSGYGQLALLVHHIPAACHAVPHHKTHEHSKSGLTVDLAVQELLQGFQIATYRIAIAAELHLLSENISSVRQQTGLVRMHDEKTWKSETRKRS